MNLTADLGDSKTFTVPMRWGNRAFEPGEVNWGLTFTVKADEDAADSTALLQASGPGTGLNLEVSGGNAIIQLLRANTYREADFPDPGDLAFQAAPGTYYWDIQATGIPGEAYDGDCRTVARGTLVLSRDITRANGPTIDVFTTEEPVFQGPPGPAPAGTGLVSVTAGVLDTPSTLRARVSADAVNLRTDLGLGSAATTASTAYEAALGNPATNGYVLSSTTGGTRSWVAVSGGGGAWGGITGTLSSQTDLQSALDGKATEAHTHVSADITDAATIATPDTLVLRGADGQASFGSQEVTFAGAGLEGYSYSGNGINGYSYSGSGIFGYSDTGTGFIGASNSGTGINGESSSGTGLVATSSNGTNHAEFGNGGDDRSFIRRVLGLFGWVRGAYVQTLGSPATLTADSALTLPDAATGELVADTATQTLTNKTLDAPTIDGAAVFTSSTRPTSSGSGTPAATSLITLGDLETRIALTIMRGLYRWSNITGQWNATHVLSGVAGFGIDTIDMYTSTTAGSVSFLRGGASRIWHLANGGNNVVNWSRRTTHSIRIYANSLTGADTVARFLLGQSNANTTAQDLVAGDKGIGFEIVAGLIFAQVANGTTLTTTSTGTTVTSNREYDLSLDCDGAGNWVAYINGTSVATGTGAPTGDSTTGNNGYCLSITNGTTAALRQIKILQHNTLQV